MKLSTELGLCLLAFLFAFMIPFFVKSPDFSMPLTALLVPVVLFSLSVSAFTMIAITPVGVPFALSAAALSALSFPVVMGFSGASFILAGGFFLACVLFMKEARDDRHDRIRISIGKHVEAGLGTFFLIFFVSAAAFSYVSFSGKAMAPGELIPDKIYDLAVGVSSRYLDSIGCSGTDTLDRCVAKIAQEQVKAGAAQASSQCDTMPAEARPACVQQITEAVNSQLPDYTKQVRENLLSQFDPDAKGAETVSAILKRGLKMKADEVLAPFAKFIPGLVAVLTYSTLNLLSFPAAFLIKAVSGAFFFVMMAMGLVTKKTEKADVEVIE